MNTWRDDPITEKQQRYIEDMYDFSEHPLPVFTGTTKGEASDFIDKYAGLAHRTCLDVWDEYQGFD